MVIACPAITPGLTKKAKPLKFEALPDNQDVGLSAPEE